MITLRLSSKAAADRVFEILDTSKEVDIESGYELKTPVKGAVSFDNVSFFPLQSESLQMKIRYLDAFSSILNTTLNFPSD